MIYLLGASHIMAILAACGAQAGQAHGFGEGLPPSFRPWPTQPGRLPDSLQVASLHVSHYAPYWGPQLAQWLPDGRLGVAGGLQQMLAAVDADPQANVLFACLRGEEYFHLSVHGIRHPFDFVLPLARHLTPDARRALLPLDVVQQRLALGMQPTLLTLAALRKLCPRLRIVHLTPPPPASSEAVEAWGAHGRDPGPPVHRVPTTVRLKLWLLYASLLEQGARSVGVEVLGPPPQAREDLGTLLPGLLGDAIHANAEYGAMVCDQMAALLIQRVKEAC